MHPHLGRIAPHLKVIAELRVLIAIRMLLFILIPQKIQGDSFALQFFQEIGEVFGQSFVFVTLLILDSWSFLKYLQQLAVCHCFYLFKLKPTGLKIFDMAIGADISWINKIESKIRGYPHPSEWKFWTGNDQYKLNIFKYKGKRVGYSLIGDNYQIAPAGAISNDYLLKVMVETLRIIKPKKDGKVKLWCPTHNIDLYRFLIDVGFRASEMEVFMADKPYPDWQRYVPATLAVI